MEHNGGLQRVGSLNLSCRGNTGPDVEAEIHLEAIVALWYFWVAEEEGEGEVVPTSTQDNDNTTTYQDPDRSSSQGHN